jgi:endonuclease-3
MVGKAAASQRRLKAESVRKLLLSIYGRPRVTRRADPVDTLVETILSQNTTDVNSHKSFQALKRAYPSWDRLLDEDTDRVAAIIRSGGLADLKAERIQGALRHILHSRGRLELDFLREMSVVEADEWLSGIKGVGPKTRAIVMLFSFGMPAFPVDTHVHRVSRRLGLIGEKVSREKAQEELAQLVPEQEFYAFHINLIEHGRRVCAARRPLCPECRLRDKCAHYAALDRRAQP